MRKKKSKQTFRPGWPTLRTLRSLMKRRIKTAGLDQTKFWAELLFRVSSNVFHRFFRLIFNKRMCFCVNLAEKLVGVSLCCFYSAAFSWRPLDLNRPKFKPSRLLILTVRLKASSWHFATRKTRSNAQDAIYVIAKFETYASCTELWISKGFIEWASEEKNNNQKLGSLEYRRDYASNMNN